jgi:toxin ParE1/3/4
MKQLKIKLSPLAEQDLLDIWQYIALDDETQATRFLEELTGKTHELGNFPDMGVDRDFLQNGLRVLFYKHYSIYYTTERDDLFVVRILHGAREVKELI